jgi:hypothetical protein
MSPSPMLASSAPPGAMGVFRELFVPFQFENVRLGPEIFVEAKPLGAVRAGTQTDVFLFKRS